MKMNFRNGKCITELSIKSSRKVAIADVREIAHHDCLH